MSEPVRLVLRRVGVGDMTLTATDIGKGRVRLSVRSDTPIEPSLANVATAARNSFARSLRARSLDPVDEAGEPVPKPKAKQP